MKTIIFIGAPGAGKGSRIKTCVDQGDYIQISSGNLLRNAGYDLSSGKLIEDSIVISLVKNAILNAKKNIILDGFPRNIFQAQELERQDVKVDKIIYIKISQEEAIYRAINRLICPNCQAVYTKTNFHPPKIEGICDECGTNLVQRKDDNEETIKERFKIFEEVTMPILDFYKSKGVKIEVFDAEKDDNSQILKLL